MIMTSHVIRFTERLKHGIDLLGLHLPRPIVFPTTNVSVSLNIVIIKNDGGVITELISFICNR
jgi:hypothetical protein